MKFLKLVSVALLAFTFVTGCGAAEKTKEVKLTAERAIAMLDAISNRMENYEKTTKDKDGNEKQIRVPYTFDVSTRMALAKDILALKFVADAFEKTRIALLMELSGGSGVIQPNTTEEAQFRVKLMAESQKEYTLNLFVFSKADLKLKDDDGFQASVLQAIIPIMTD